VQRGRGLGQNPFEELPNRRFVQWNAIELTPDRNGVQHLLTLDPDHKVDPGPGQERCDKGTGQVTQRLGIDMTHVEAGLDPDPAARSPGQ
jgi:hypothetical protein